MRPISGGLMPGAKPVVWRLAVFASCLRSEPIVSKRMGISPDLGQRLLNAPCQLTRRGVHACNPAVSAEIPQQQHSGQSLLHCRAGTNSLLIGRPGGCRSSTARAPPQSTTTAARVAKRQGSELRLSLVVSVVNSLVNEGGVMSPVANLLAWPAVAPM